jgi:hypothetical protein
MNNRISFFTVVAKSVKRAHYISMKHLTLLLIVALMVLPSCKKADVEPLGQALIVSFEASSTLTAVYAPVTLIWEVKNADMVILTDAGLVQAVGSRDVNPQETTTYTLMAEGADGVKVSKSLTIDVDRGQACTGLRVSEYAYIGGGDMYVKVGPNLNAFYAARNVVIRWTLHDSKGNVLQVYDGIIPKIMPGESGEITINGKKISFATSKVEIINCDSPLVKP